MRKYERTAPAELCKLIPIFVYLFLINIPLKAQETKPSEKNKILPERESETPPSVLRVRKRFLKDLEAIGGKTQGRSIDNLNHMFHQIRNRISEEWIKAPKEIRSTERLERAMTELDVLYEIGWARVTGDEREPSEVRKEFIGRLNRRNRQFQNFKKSKGLFDKYKIITPENVLEMLEKIDSELKKLNGSDSENDD